MQERLLDRAKLFLVLGGGTALMPATIDMYLPALPRLVTDFDSSTAVVQLTIAGSFVGSGIGALLMGSISDVAGRRRPLLIGLTGYTAASIACAFAPDIHVLIVLRFIQGVTGASAAVIARATVRDLHNGVAAARYFSRLMLINGLAPILAPIIGSQILGFTSWRGIFIALAGVGLALLAASYYALPETLPPERRRAGGLAKTGGAMAKLLRHRAFVGYALLQSCTVAAMFSYISGSSFVLQDLYDVSTQVYSLLFAINALGLVAASQLCGFLVRRVEPGRILVAGCACGLTGGALLLAVVTVGGVGLWGILPAFFVVASSMGFALPVATALALADHPDAAGAGSALLAVSGLVLGAAMAPVVGIAGSQTVLPLAIVVASLEAVAALALTLTGTRPRRRPKPVGLAQVEG